MASEDNTSNEQQPQEKKKKSFKRLLLPLLLILNVTGMTGGLYLSYLGTLGMNHPVMGETQAAKHLYEEEIFNGKPAVYALDPFTVNLADEDERIVQIKVSLEMLDENGFEEVVSMGSHARDSIVKILNGKEFDELQSIQGKLFLKDEITVALNKQLKRSFIKDIYFSRFVLQ